MEEITKFDQEKKENIEALGRDRELKKLGMDFAMVTSKHKYTYNFTWLGRPIIQFPQDIMAMQEIIWQVKPDLIIETGIAHGGSLIFYASMMELLGGAGMVIGVDLDIRSHNRAEIERHPMFKRITMFEGSSIDQEVVKRIAEASRSSSNVLVVLDSNHTHEHVLRELELYSPYVTRGSYLVVFDTAIEEMPEGFFQDRPWGKGNNPMTAVKEFLSKTDRFVVDSAIEHKLLITVAPHGYLKCIKD